MLLITLYNKCIISIKPLNKQKVQMHNFVNYSVYSNIFDFKSKELNKSCMY